MPTVLAVTLRPAPENGKMQRHRRVAAGGEGVDVTFPLDQKTGTERPVCIPKESEHSRRGFATLKV